jgi:hypothetical protein
MAGKRWLRPFWVTSSFYSSNDSRLHFGLGNDTLVGVEVHWPGGLVESFKQLPINQLVMSATGSRTSGKPWLVEDLNQEA